MKKQYHGITVNDLYNSLYKKVNHLVDEILEYESDTFSSESSELTPAEAEKIAFIFILRDIDDRIIANTMDGHMIDTELYYLRETK
jgi:hypothetical protein